MQVRDNVSIQHAENQGEFKIPQTNYWADGYCKETNTIYEFLGDFWHGNPKIYDSEKINYSTGCTFGELYNKTNIREERVKSLGYNYKIVWEYEWRNGLTALRKIQKIWRRCQN